MLMYSVNLWGVVIAAISTMVIGMLWYSPFMFGKKWMQLVGMTHDMSLEAKRRAKYAYILMTISAFVMAYVLALFLENLFAPSLIDMLKVAALAWVGFIATSMLGEYLFNAKPKPWALYVLNSGYQLASLLINAMILWIFLR